MGGGLLWSSSLLAMLVFGRREEVVVWRGEGVGGNWQLSKDVSLSFPLLSPFCGGGGGGGKDSTNKASRKHICRYAQK